MFFLSKIIIFHHNFKLFQFCFKLLDLIFNMFEFLNKFSWQILRGITITKLVCLPTSNLCSTMRFLNNNVPISFRSYKLPRLRTTPMLKLPISIYVVFLKFSFKFAAIKRIYSYTIHFAFVPPPHIFCTTNPLTNYISFKLQRVIYSLIKFTVLVKVLDYLCLKQFDLS